MLFSKSTRGFYDPEIHGDNIPADAVELTKAEHVALLDAQSQGKCIDADVNGRPVAVDPPLDSIKAAKIAQINAACAAEITGGFSSSALGSPHTYDSELEDQLNLIGAAGLGVDLPYTCTDVNGVKARRNHTAAQIAQVMSDGAAIKLAALGKAAGLKDAVAAAADVAAVEAVVW